MKVRYGVQNLYKQHYSSDTRQFHPCDAQYSGAFPLHPAAENRKQCTDSRFSYCYFTLHICFLLKMVFVSIYNTPSKVSSLILLPIHQLLNSLVYKGGFSRLTRGDEESGKTALRIRCSASVSPWPSSGSCPDGILPARCGYPLPSICRLSDCPPPGSYPLWQAVHRSGAIAEGHTVCHFRSRSIFPYPGNRSGSPPAYRNHDIPASLYVPCLRRSDCHSCL